MMKIYRTDWSTWMICCCSQGVTSTIAIGTIGDWLKEHKLELVPHITEVVLLLVRKPVGRIFITVEEKPSKTLKLYRYVFRCKVKDDETCEGGGCKSRQGSEASGERSFQSFQSCGSKVSSIYKKQIFYETLNFKGKSTIVWNTSVQRNEMLLITISA